MFEGSAQGATAIKRDAAGRYYVLAKPPLAISIYNADGAAAGRVPALESASNSVVYATDFALDADGHVLIADRGANAVEIFSPAGGLIQKIPVFGPVSIAALPENEFAVVTLRAQAPVEIMDEHGKLIRMFGGLSEALTSTADANSSRSSPLAEPGAIANDSAGHLYYAVASGPDPSLRRYDRYGFISYDTALPPSGPAPARGTSDDRVQFGFDVSQMGFSEQASGWATLGTSGRLNFGSSVGMGFRSLLGGTGGGTSAYTGPLTGGSTPLASTPNGLSGMNLTSVAGEGSLEHGEFHFGVGLGASGAGRGARGRRGATATRDGDNGEPLLGNILEFGDDDSIDANAPRTYTTSSFDASDLTSPGGDSATSLLFANGNAATADVLLSPDSAAETMPLGVGFFPGGGSFGGGFHGAGLHPPGGELGALGTPDGRFTNGESFNQFVPGAFVSAGPGKTPHFRLHGELGPDIVTATASVRVNLDRSRAPSDERQRVTAIATDSETGETWAAMGSTLVRLDTDGNVLDSFYLAAPDGSALRATSLVVEPRRIIVATELLGIYEFARPDESNHLPRASTSPESPH